MWPPAQGRIGELGWGIGIVQSDAGTLKPLPGELTGKAVDVVCYSTLCKFRRSADKEDFQSHQGYDKDPEESDGTIKGQPSGTSPTAFPDPTSSQDG
jgi:hypothetical protein